MTRSSFLILSRSDISGLPMLPPIQAVRGVQSCCCDASYQRGGGCFSRRTGDTDHLAGYFLHKDLCIIGDRDTPETGFNDQRIGQWNSTGKTNELDRINGLPMDVHR